MVLFIFRHYTSWFNICMVYGEALKQLNRPHDIGSCLIVPLFQVVWRSSRSRRPWSWWRRCGPRTWGWWRLPSRSSGKTSRRDTRRTSSGCTRRERVLCVSGSKFYVSFVKLCTYLCLTSKYRSVYYCNTKFSLVRVRTDDRNVYV